MDEWKRNTRSRVPAGRRDDFPDPQIGVVTLGRLDLAELELGGPFFHGERELGKILQVLEEQGQVGILPGVQLGPGASRRPG